MLKMYMKRIFINMMAGVLAIGGLCSCEQQAPTVFEEAPGIYFARKNGQNDSIAHTFFSVQEKQERDTIFVELLTMGKPFDVARPVRIVQTNVEEADADIAGKHFVAFDDPEVVDRFAIAPGQVSVELPVILLRDKSLKSEEVKLKMKVEANEWFVPGIDQNREFMIKTTELATPPDSWKDRWYYVWGDWGSRKMWFIVNYLGFTNFDESVESGYRNYLKVKAHEKLEEYNNTHDEPLCEDAEKKHGGVKCENCVQFPN